MTTSHLPECVASRVYTVDQTGQQYRSCICMALRACEERVDKAWEDAMRIIEANTRDAALDAARDAVASAPVAIHQTGVLLVNRDVALAAIDALRTPTDETP